ncbi:MAG TPA: SPOR domain-containing protein [Actinomycetota bacterium]
MYDETSPYDTRWPHPGPAMVLVAALAGLIGGIVLGLAVSAFQGPSSKASASPPTTTPAVSTTLPDRFFTVQLASFNNAGPRPDATVARYRAQHIDVAVLNSSDYHGFTPGFWVIYSGTLSTRTDARAYQQKLVSDHPGLDGGVVKGPITRR